MNSSTDPVLFPLFLDEHEKPEVAIEEVIRGLDSDTIALLKETESFNAVVGYMAECELIGEPCSIVIAMFKTDQLFRVRSAVTRRDSYDFGPQERAILERIVAKASLSV